MNSHTGAGGHVPLTFGGIPVHQRLTGAVHDLAARVLARLVDQVPVYATLPAEQRTETRRVIEQGIRAFATILRTGQLPSEAELQVLRQSAAKRAEDGMPVEAVISAYHVGAHECLERMAPHATREDMPQLQAAHMLVLRFLERMTTTVVAGYLAERQAVASDEQSARQAMLTALLDGEDVQGTAARCGIGLPPCYLVVGLAIGPHPDESADGVSSVMAGRRKLRRLRVELDRHVDGAVLTALSGAGGIALIPWRTEEAQLSARDWTWLGQVVSHMSRVADVDIVAGVAAAVPEEVGEAAELVEEIRRVAVAAGRPPGVYHLTDVLLEYQLMQPGPARDALARLMRPLADRPELLSTLRTFLDCGLSRQLTAERLRVHPNTVDYRLRRAAEATGLDATSGTDVLRVRAALSAHDACA
ncbi:helix-turn-helix domain-containing protein [Streptomyces sp. NBC_00390]|uniref:PucR family transcriptional regulator n=1 Tax=Streptomyces sp. NBC_00390 TaxID=2975736 RepID=UPI002E1C2EC0